MQGAASAFGLGKDPGKRAQGSCALAPLGCRREPVACNIWKPFLSDFAARLTCSKGRAAPWLRREAREEAEHNQNGSTAIAPGIRFIARR